MKAIATFSHSHPFYSKGGGEIVAYNSFKSQQARGLPAYLYCAVNQALKPDLSIFTPGEHLIEFTKNEFIFPARVMDSFLFSHEDRRFFPSIVRQLAQQDIGVFHFHHFWNVGTDLIRELMACFPKAKFALTIHEYLAICMRDGQMIRRGNNSLCTQQTDIECHMCFPNLDKDHFKARRMFFQDFIQRFDLVISPSSFLAERFVDWGLDKDIVVLENGQVPRLVPDQPGLDDETISKKFAFFGQANPFKGLDVFVSAATQIEQQDITFAIYGCTRARFNEQFGSQWDAAIDKIGARLQFLGQYDPEQVCELMQQNGWIVVPSIWWENSPLVIQEAFMAKRPPIVANIGGMREKVEHGVNGLHFSARNSAALADVFRRAGGNAALWRDLSSGIVPPPTIDEMTQSTIELYESIRK
jgi:glycosyltransferase involved in cell wall biosynthesis